jgi:UDP-N-acetyl-D-mannosaminuronic acid transferase (WecB/TagA/CpsF family)
MSERGNERQILGVNFYVGDVQGAIRRLSSGGLLVVPAAPALKDVAVNDEYREALTNADVAIADSAFMVLLWNLMEGDSIPRLSGLKYLKELLRQQDVRTAGNTFWVMAGNKSARKNTAWLRSEGIEVPEDCVYEAPIYGSKIEDPALIEKLQTLRPKHVVITVGGGTQERLGLYLKRNLDYLPAIHCIGAAIAFLSGDQVRIPNWADRLYLGWLFRCLSSPRRFVPRYLSAPQLIPLLWRYRNQLPVPHGNDQVLTQIE